jgi:hypothetical protein
MSLDGCTGLVNTQAAGPFKILFGQADLHQTSIELCAEQQGIRIPWVNAYHGRQVVNRALRLA